MCFTISLFGKTYAFCVNTIMYHLDQRPQQLNRNILITIHRWTVVNIIVKVVDKHLHLIKLDKITLAPGWIQRPSMGFPCFTALWHSLVWCSQRYTAKTQNRTCNQAISTLMSWAAEKIVLHRWMG